MPPPRVGGTLQKLCEQNTTKVQGEHHSNVVFDRQTIYFCFMHIIIFFGKIQVLFTYLVLLRQREVLLRGVGRPVRVGDEGEQLRLGRQADLVAS